ncbi:hypothetical protein Tco_0950130 [Tanacetum coccineum]
MPVEDYKNRRIEQEKMENLGKMKKIEKRKGQLQYGENGEDGSVGDDEEKSSISGDQRQGKGWADAHLLSGVQRKPQTYCKSEKAYGSAKQSK